ncbi:transketolase family protein, partial [bacterium]|nr:transketolase family protein [bacterium]
MGAKATRDSFGEELRELGKSNPSIVVLDADLSVSTKSVTFAKAFPERFFQMGIAEANMIGTAAGMAFSGFVPFCCSFGCFLTGKYETIRVSVGYSQANVKLVGTHAGLGIGEDGYTQMGLEDMNLMRGLPGMMVFNPADDKTTRAAVRFAAEHRGPVYLRLTRQKLPDLHASADVFKPG